MKLLRNIISSLLPAGLLALQLSCGGDTSGPVQGAGTIAPNSFTTVIAPPGAQVAAAELPSVIVNDLRGLPMAGVPVTFAVAVGGGSITGGTATTNSAGIATVGSWTLGSGEGANVLTASSGTLAPITFTACATPAHTIGSSATYQLATTDCRFQDGSFVDFFAVTIPTAGTYIFNQSSTTFDTFLALLATDGTQIGTNDDFGAPGTTDSRVKVIVPAGSYLLGANSVNPNVTGAYSLTSTASTAQVTNCEDVFVFPGITTLQSLQATDCTTNVANPASGFAFDEYVVFLNAGQTVTVSMTSATLDSYLELRIDGGATVTSNDNIDATTKDARITFTVPVSTTTRTAGFFVITAATKVAGALGDYTLTVQ
jgi:hypothetical protein